MPFPLGHRQLRREITMLKRLLVLPAVLVMAYFPSPVGSPVPQKNKSAAAESEKAPAISTRVKEIYKFDCAMCHGDTGDGKTDLGQSMGVTTNFTDPKSFEGKTDQQLFDAIRKGKDKMPPEDAPRATDDQVRGLVHYLRSLAKDKPAGDPASQPAATPPPAAAAPSTN
jgi:mono/diheme cytochrome c family protein